MDTLPAELIVAIAAHLGEPDRAALRAATPWLAASLPAAWCFDLEARVLQQRDSADPEMLRDMLRAINPVHVRHPLELALVSVRLGHTAVAVQLTECHRAAFARADAIFVYLRAAAFNGHLEVCRWLTETFQLTVEDARSHITYALKLAARKGHLAVCRLLAETFQLTAEDARAHNNVAFRWAAENGHLTVCRWLTETFQLTAEDARADDNFAFQFAATNCHWDVCRWLVKTFQLTAQDARGAFMMAAWYGRLDVCRWLTKTFDLTAAYGRSEYNEAFLQARTRGHTKVCSWLTETFGVTIKS